MSRWRHVVAWAMLILVGLTLAAVGVLLIRDHLDAADKWASVGSACLALIGLALSGYGIVLARRTLAALPPSIQIAATGSRSLAAEDVSGPATFGDRSGVVSGPDASLASPPCVEDTAPVPSANASHNVTEKVADPPASAPDAITASGKRSLAAERVSGLITFGDDSPIQQ